MNQTYFFKPAQFRYLLLLLLISSLIGCNGAPTQSPVLPALPPPPKMEPEGETTIKAGEQIAIHASSEGALSYKWVLNSGEGTLSPDTGDVTLYTAPNSEGKIAIVSVVAHNAQGDSPTSSLVINIAENLIVPLDATTGIPAGWMSGQGNPSAFIDFKTAASGCHTGNNCTQIEYKPGALWAGIMWWPLSCGASGTPDAWQKAKDGLCNVKVFSQENALPVRLTFWARGDRGNEIVQFKVGAADIPPSPGRSTGEISLKPTWEKFDIGLTDMDLKNAVALFTWVATDAANPNGAIFYIDDIQFEGLK